MSNFHHRTHRPATILPIITLRPSSHISPPSLPPKSISAHHPHRKHTHIASATASLTRQHTTLKFLAGGLAGCLSTLFTNPLDVIRTRIQASAPTRSARSLQSVITNVMRAEGARGFYSGLRISLVGTIPSRSIYFSTYAATKKMLIRLCRGDGAHVHLLSAVTAGATSNFVMSPLWVIRTRMQLYGRRYTSYQHAFSTLLKTEGVSALYRGFSASLWGTSEAAIHFMLYEKLKHTQRERTGRELTPLQYTLTAGLSKLVASVATYPHERVRVLMREIPKAGGVPKYRGMVQSLRLVAKEEGWRALYRGMGCHLARTVPNTALMFLSYELISKRLEALYKRRLADLHRREASADRRSHSQDVF